MSESNLTPEQAAMMKVFEKVDRDFGSLTRPALPKRGAAGPIDLYYSNYNFKPGSSELYKQGDAGYDNIQELRTKVITDLGLSIFPRDHSNEDKKAIYREMAKRNSNFSAALNEFNQMDAEWKKATEYWKLANPEEANAILEMKRFRRQATSKPH